jgi:hypothetical protein
MGRVPIRSAFHWLPRYIQMQLPVPLYTTSGTTRDFLSSTTTVGEATSPSTFTYRVLSQLEIGAYKLRLGNSLHLSRKF